MKVWSCRWLLMTGLLALTACGEGERLWLDQRGEPISQSDLSGRYQVVNYWAEWCAPCRDELPELNALADSYPQLAVIGIHFDRAEGEALLALSERMGIEFSVLGHDYADEFGLVLPRVLPTTYLLDPEGRVLASLEGPQDKAQLLAALAEQGAELE
ncbi:TlpA family protein disulfide reductase [Halopseudomonas salegens]|uniref:Thiol-disulfide isomerase or thioredoxin n=1 Tax=Halopseudomonas salegens TaxID=1434072 RepID=A0A1H2G2B9_9GAMM|nr:TlpA disulfide reductase family protein [Halopseudomonas salegens]SDU13701.1 Thiol-disulfide isomerase or thioredoxin [Halopseudomonas salegens]